MHSFFVNLFLLEHEYKGYDYQALFFRLRGEFISRLEALSSIVCLYGNICHNLTHLLFTNTQNNTSQQDDITVSESNIRSNNNNMYDKTSSARSRKRLRSSVSPNKEEKSGVYVNCVVFTVFNVLYSILLHQKIANKKRPKLL